MGTKVLNKWTLVVAGLIINLCIGTVYAWSVFRLPLHEAPYNLTPAESVIPFSVFLLLAGITAAFSGRMIGKVGPRPPAFIGAFLLGFGYLLCYYIAIFPEFTLLITIIAFGIIGGTGCGYAYNPPIAVVGRWFSDKRGLGLGLTVMGFGLSALITAPAVAAMISMFGLSNTFLVLGIVFLVLLLLLGSLMKFPLEKRFVSTTSIKFRTEKSWSLSSIEFRSKEMIKTSAFFLSWFIFLIGSGAGLMIIGYAKLIATDIAGLKGSLEWLATLSVSVLAVSNAIGRPLFGMICDRISPKKALLTIQGIQLFCLVALFPYSKFIPLFFLGIILFAVTFGAYMSVMPALVSYFFGPKNLGPNYGLYGVGYGVGGVVCPMLMAVIVGSNPTYETYVNGFYAAAVLLLIAFLLSSILKPPDILEKEL